jgi:hypothetical protein
LEIFSAPLQLRRSGICYNFSIGGRDHGVLRRHLLLAEKETDLDVKINSDCDKFEAVIVRVSYWSVSV